MSVLDMKGNPAASEPEKQAEKPAEGNTADVKHGICPHCGGERVGLVWDFFQNIMQVSGKVAMVSYAMCSCQQCGKILNTTILGMVETNVQSPDDTQLLHGARRHRH